MLNILFVVLIKFTCENALSNLPLDAGNENKNFAKRRAFCHSDEFGQLNSCHHTDL